MIAQWKFKENLAHDQWTHTASKEQCIGEEIKTKWYFDN